MKKCPFCGAQMNDDSLFCTECGKQIPQGNACSHCGAAVNNDDTFCQNCGNKVDGGNGQQVPPVTIPEQKHCPHCGAVVSNDSLFCENCGRSMADGGSASTPNFHPQAPYEPRSNSQNKFVLPIVIGMVVLALAGGGWWYYKSFKPNTSDFVVAPNNTDSIADVQETFVEDAVIEEVQDTIASDNIVEDLIVSEDFQYSDATTEYDAVTVASAEEITREQEMQPQQSETSNKVYETAERMPSFPGGAEALFRFLNSNMRYPEVAEENGVQGRVLVTFIVERDGAISDVKVAKSVDPSLDKEAVRIIKSMPRWNPGTQDGKPVRVKYTVPVTFKLQ